MPPRSARLLPKPSSTSQSDERILPVERRRGGDRRPLSPPRPHRASHRRPAMTCRRNGDARPSAGQHEKPKYNKQGGPCAAHQHAGQEGPATGQRRPAGPAARGAGKSMPRRRRVTATAITPARYPAPALQRPFSDGSRAAGGRFGQVHLQNRHVEGIGDLAVFLVLEQQRQRTARRPAPSTESGCWGRSTMVMVSQPGRVALIYYQAPDIRCGSICVSSRQVRHSTRTGMPAPVKRAPKSSGPVVLLVDRGGSSPATDRRRRRQLTSLAGTPTAVQPGGHRFEHHAARRRPGYIRRSRYCPEIFAPIDSSTPRLDLGMAVAGFLAGAAAREVTSCSMETSILHHRGFADDDAGAANRRS